MVATRINAGNQMRLRRPADSTGASCPKGQDRVASAREDARLLDDVSDPEWFALTIADAEQHPQDLARLPVIATSATGQQRQWPFLDGGNSLSVRLEPRLIVTANQAAISAACLGLGLTRVLSYQVASQVAAGELEVVLAQYELPPLPIHVVYQGGRKAPARIRSFVDFAVNELRDHPALQD